VLGLAYKKDIDDPRESPAFKVIELLEGKGATVTCHDPSFKKLPAMRHYKHIKAKTVDLTEKGLREADATIIVNHTGMPLGYGPFAGRPHEVLAQWRATMPAIAACPNVVMKLGGMMMRLAAFDYHTAERPASSEQLAACWRPYIEPCIELFGAERCTFESNFPVDKMGITYAALWNAFKRIAAAASPGEKAALFSGTARRVYRLDQVRL